MNAPQNQFAPTQTPQPSGSSDDAWHVPVPQVELVSRVKHSLRQRFVATEHTLPQAQGHASPTAPAPGTAQVVVPSARTTTQAVPDWQAHSVPLGHG
jgi:hypothetical protein